PVGWRRIPDQGRQAQQRLRPGDGGTGGGRSSPADRLRLAGDPPPQPGRRRDARGGHLQSGLDAARPGPGVGSGIPDCGDADLRRTRHRDGTTPPRRRGDGDDQPRRTLGAGVEPGDEKDMARRLGWFVGAAALVLVLARLGRVLEPAVDTPDWRLVVPVTTVGAALITLATARLTPLKQLVIHAFLLGLVVLRITASETLTFGVLPGADTLAVLAERLTYAFELLRFGAPPVLAVPGLTALATLALWAFGSVWAASIVTGRTWAGIVPALGFYLYLAVVDRAPASNSWYVAFALIAALGLVATSNVVSAGAGQLRASDDRPVPRWEAGPAGRAA